MKEPLSKEKILDALRRELPYLREKYGVERIALYGSFAAGSPTEESDVDFIVHLSKPLGFAFVSLIEHLEKVLGRKVDLATFETLQRSLQNPRHKPVASRVERTMTYVETETG